MKGLLILDRDEQRRIIRRRRRLGLDRHDEVWNGVYVMSPEANNEHQALLGDLLVALANALANEKGVKVRPALNITDRPVGWRQNFRCPDLNIFLPGSTAEDRGSHFLGGADFTVEIVSPGDRSRQKIDFYAAVGVQELLLIDRDPWRLELYRKSGDTLALVGTSDPEGSQDLPSVVLPLVFRLVPGDPRPQIEVRRADGAEHWLV